ncbi:putative tetratricopeptide-like helical domain superfamily [Dioscorea sansibarensis]
MALLVSLKPSTFEKPVRDSPPVEQSSGLLLPALQSVVDARRFPSKTSFISAIRACSAALSVSQAKPLHALIFKAGLSSDRFVATSLIDLYSSCGFLRQARQVFDGITDRDVILETSMLTGLLDHGEFEDANELFDEMPERDVVAWNAMISGCSRGGLPDYALELFRGMQASMVRPNGITLIGVLSACSQLGCLPLGLWVHAYVTCHLDGNESPALYNALVHMYAKCGHLDAALQVFIEQEPKNLESWNTMLNGFAIHGCGTSALSLFSQMIKIGLLPDRISFIGVLMACSHAGLIDDARYCFYLMRRMYGIEPKAEHYGCLVDALCRRGYIDEAWMVINSMPFEMNAGVYGALLGGCLRYRNYGLGLEIARHLIEIEPWEESRYMVLFKLYAMLGRDEEAMNVRKVLDEKGIKKSSGSSAIEVDGVVHEFLAKDRAHCQSEDIYSMLAVLGSTLELEWMNDMQTMWDIIDTN